MNKIRIENSAKCRTDPLAVVLTEADADDLAALMAGGGNDHRHIQPGVNKPTFAVVPPRSMPNAYSFMIHLPLFSQRSPADFYLVNSIAYCRSVCNLPVPPRKKAPRRKGRARF